MRKDLYYEPLSELWGQGLVRPPEDDPELCEECGAVVQDTAAVDRECWRCGEAL